MNNRRFATVTAVTALTAALVSGCTPGTPRKEASSTQSAAGLPSGVAQAGKVPTKVPNEPAARKNVRITDCARTDTGWKAAGTAANPGKKKTTYKITVFFTTEKATVLQTADTKVTVEPGKSAEWKAEKKFTPADKTLCALRGVGTE